jgi:hypothetical protein
MSSTQNTKLTKTKSFNCSSLLGTYYLVPQSPSFEGLCFLGKKGSDQLGISVCVSGNKIIAGAPNQNGSPYPYYGAAYIFKESSEDCNANNSPDECDIEDGTSGDLNSDGVPDEC